MWWAARKGHADVVALLREAGAESVWRARLRVAVRLTLLSPFLLLAAASERARAHEEREREWCVCER